MLVSEVNLRTRVAPQDILWNAMACFPSDSQSRLTDQVAVQVAFVLGGDPLWRRRYRLPDVLMPAKACFLPRKKQAFA